MSDETIRVGDLVMVVKPSPCCKSVAAIGWTFKAEIIRQTNASCAICNTLPSEPVAWYIGSDYSIQISRLKKINPPPIKESIETKDEVTA